MSNIRRPARSLLLCQHFALSRVLDVSRDVSCLFSWILQILHVGNPHPQRRLDVPDTGQQNAQQALKRYTLRQVALLVSLGCRFRLTFCHFLIFAVCRSFCLRNLHKNRFEVTKSKSRRISRPRAHGCSVKEK